MDIVRYIKNKKLLLFFFVVSFYKLYKYITQILFFIYKLTKKGKKHIKEKQSKALTTIKKKYLIKNGNIILIIYH